MIDQRMGRFSILTLILALVIPVCGMASSGEAGVAGWEAEAQRRIHGEHVIECVVSTHRGTILLDARSDDRTFAELRAIRSSARAALESGKCSGVVASYFRTVLGNAGEADLVPLGRAERELCATDVLIAAGGSVSCGLEPVPGDAESRWRAGVAAATAPGAGPHGKRDASKWTSSSSRPPRVCAGNINLCDYRCDSAKVDYWRLYLYRWEDLPWLPESRITAPPRARASARANASITPERFKKPKNRPVLALTPGAPGEMVHCPLAETRTARAGRIRNPKHITAAPALPSAPPTSIIREVSV
jgi:hypothetical protein